MNAFSAMRPENGQQLLQKTDNSCCIIERIDV